MDWLSRAFEGTSDEISGRQYGWRYGQNTSWVSQPETEELDRAIAKISSASEGMGKLKINDASQLKNNELLPRILNSQNINESQKWLADYSSHLKKNELLASVLNSPYSTVFRICGGCNLVIGHEVVLSRMGAVWHPECFRCRKCNLPIADNEFSLSGKDAYHKSCYKENDHPRCDVCQNYIRINADGFIEYNEHPFWGVNYCIFHDHDGTPKCCSCERMEKKGTPVVALNDGRKLCLECVDSSILDTTECQPLYLDIQQYYESLNMKIEQKIPLLLVERQALNKARNRERNGHYHMPETRGICLSEEQTISTVSRQPRIGIGNRVPSMRIEPYKLIRHCEVTAILVLYGLPRLLTGSILAHEMMHAWLRLKGYRILSQDVEEGICQVLGHMWLTSRVAIISRHEKLSPFEKKLAELFKHQIESDTTMVYGNGFRAGNRAVLKYGLQNTLHHIKATGKFPY